VTDHRATFVISTLIFREGSDWIAQGLEYDICAQAKTLEQVHIAFAEAVAANVAVCIELDRLPLEGIDAAPKRYWDMYKEASLWIEAEPFPIRMPHPTAVPSIIPQYKVLEQRIPIKALEQRVA
jgi:hypothetical protein